MTTQSIEYLKNALGVIVDLKQNAYRQIQQEIPSPTTSDLIITAAIAMQLGQFVAYANSLTYMQELLKILQQEQQT